MTSIFPKVTGNVACFLSNISYSSNHSSVWSTTWSMSGLQNNVGRLNDSKLLCYKVHDCVPAMTFDKIFDPSFTRWYHNAATDVSP